MGKGDKNAESVLRVGDATSNLPLTTVPNIAVTANGKGQYTWEEIRRHTTKTDRWLVIDKRVFDVTRWTKHPGGQAILNYYAGQDATVSARRSIGLVLTRLICLGRLSSLSRRHRFSAKIPQVILHR